MRRALAALLWLSVVAGYSAAGDAPPPAPRGKGDSLPAAAGLACFEIAGPWEDTPADPRATYLARAIRELVAYPTFTRKLCSEHNRPITLSRDPQLGRGGYSPWDTGEIFFGNDVKTEVDLLYTLAHEAGHVFAHRNRADAEAFYRDAAIRAEGFLPTYPNTPTVFEDLPETIGLIVSAQFKFFTDTSRYHARTGKTGTFDPCAQPGYAQHCAFGRAVVGERQAAAAVFAEPSLLQDDCDTRCTGDAYTACMSAYQRGATRSGWIYKPDLMRNVWREGGVSAGDAGAAGSACEAPGLSCSAAPFDCYKRCGCAQDVGQEPRVPAAALAALRAEHPDKLLYVLVDKSRRWLFLYDAQGAKVMDFQVAVGADNSTTPGLYRFSEICVDESYCETYTPASYPQADYPDLYSRRPGYYAGQSMFVDTCGLQPADREAICDSGQVAAAADPPQLCLQPDQRLPADWTSQVHEVSCTTQLEYNNQHYAITLADKRTIPYPGPYGVMWGRLTSLTTGWTQRGIHGTNERGILGLAETHGCVRAFNYDVWRLYRHILATLEQAGHKDQLDRALISIVERF